MKCERFVPGVSHGPCGVCPGCLSQWPGRVDLWPLLNELERAAWSRSFKRVQAARKAIEQATGSERPTPRIELESASQFRRITAMEESRAEAQDAQSSTD